MPQGSVIESSVPEEDLVDVIDEPETEIEDVDAAAAAEQADWERQARVQGWRPFEEYRGPAGGWVDAKTFVERGRDFVPYLRKNLAKAEEANARLTGEVTGLRSTVESLKADLQKYLNFARRAGKEAYDRAISDMETQRRDAVAAGDTATYDAVTERIGKMEEARSEEIDVPEPMPAPAPVPKPAVARDPVIEQFVADNPWFISDPELNSLMIAEDKIVQAESPGMDRIDQLQAAKEAVMRRRPKKFGLNEEPVPTPRPRAPAGGMAPTPPARPTAKKGIDAISDPNERREMREGFTRAKRSTPDITEEEYLAIARDPHADVLAVMDESKTSRRTRK